MIWSLLIGNTRAVAALMEGQRVLKKLIVPTDHLGEASAVRAWARAARRNATAEGIIAASVVPPVEAAVRRAFGEAFGKRPRFISAEGAPGLRVRVRKPAQVGADRLANAAAARALYGAPSIVVDYGTGITFDVVDKGGAYCGGAILPGLGISLRALHDYTARLPLVEFKPVSFAVGKTTQEAVRSGVYHGAVGATRELLLLIRKSLGCVAPAVATGGWCRVFRDAHIFHDVDPDLTFKGLSILWEHREARLSPARSALMRRLTRGGREEAKKGADKA